MVLVSSLFRPSRCSFQGEDEESEDDGDYAPDARGGSDAESSSDSDGDNDEDSDSDAQQKSHKRPGTGSTKSGASKKQVGYVCPSSISVHIVRLAAKPLFPFFE